MKVAVFGLDDFPLGKHSLSDERLDFLEGLFESKKVTTLPIEFVSIQEIKDAEVVVSREDKKEDLVLSDLEYVQDRLAKETSAQDKELFSKAKDVLEKEEFLFKHFDKDNLKILRGFPLITVLPIYLFKNEGEIDVDSALRDIYYLSGRIIFFTAGEKESRMWTIRNGETALDAAGCIHSDIQQGFIRAEIVSMEDLKKAGHYNQAKNDGKVRLEGKEYIIKDGDIILFRFNK